MRPLLLLTLILSACSSSTTPSASDAGTNTSTKPYDLKTPQLTAVTPSSVAVGDTVQVLGTNFIPADQGTSTLEFAGQFEDWEDNPQVKTSVDLKVVDSGHATFVYGPNNIFSAADTTGTFKGQVRVRSQAKDGREATSATINANVDVGPSIIVTALHSVDDQCVGVTAATLAQTNLALGAKVIGIGGSSADEPIHFKISFASPGLSSQYVPDGNYNIWPPANPASIADGAPGDNYFNMDVTSGNELFINPRVKQTPVRIYPPVQLGHSAQSTTGTLYRFMTGAYGGLGYATANFTIEATNARGSVRRSVSLSIYNPGEAKPYDGTFRVAEVFPATLAVDCVSGGDTGRELTLTDTRGETRSTSLNFTWNSQVGSSSQFGGAGSAGVGFIQGSANYEHGQNWTQVFGHDVNSTISSEKSFSEALNIHVLPTYFAVLYRQASRIERSLDVVLHNACGQSLPAGKAILTDWLFRYDAAQGPDCPPPTNLPPAQKF